MKDPVPLTLEPLPKKPLVSVLMANYNYANFVGKAIESVLRQSYQNFELIICDDGSTDNSLEVLRNYSKRDPRIKLLEKKNGGQASALNMAFSHSKGDIVTFLDADDEWFVDRLERVVEAFHSGAGRVGLVQHPLRVVSQHGVTLATRFPYFLESGWLLPKALAGENLGLATATGISLHAQVASLVFPLPESFRSWADRLIADRAAFVTETLCLREVLGIYRQHGRNTTGYIGVATIEEAKSQVDKLKALLEEHKSFIRSWIPDADTSHLGKEAIGTALCFLSLISGEYLSYKKLRKLVNSKRAVLWYLLFLMPRPLGLHTYLLWRKSPLKLTSIVRTRAGK